MGIRTLPSELLHLIIYHLAQLSRKSLIQCTLVSHGFYTIAREHIWKHFKLGLRDFLVRPERLQHFPDMCYGLRTPRAGAERAIISYIRSFSLVLPPSGQCSDGRFLCQHHKMRATSSLISIHSSTYLTPSRQIAHPIQLYPTHPAPQRPTEYTHSISMAAPNFRASGVRYGHISGVRFEVFSSDFSVHPLCVVKLEKIWGIPTHLLARSSSLHSLSLVSVKAYTHYTTPDPPTPPLIGGAGASLASLVVDNSKIHVIPKDLETTASGPTLASPTRAPNVLEAVPGSRFIQHFTSDLRALKKLDFAMRWTVQLSEIERVLQTVPCCEELVLRSDIQNLKHLPYNTLPPCVRHLTIIPTNSVAFTTPDVDWDISPEAPGLVFLDDLELVTIADAVFVPTLFGTTDTGSGTFKTSAKQVALPRVTIHRNVTVTLPPGTSPTADFTPSTTPHPPSDSPSSSPDIESFWDLFATTVYTVPADEVEVYIHVQVVILLDELDLIAVPGKFGLPPWEEGRAEKEKLKVIQEEGKICKIVESAFLNGARSIGSAGGPAVKLFVSAEFER